MSVPIVDFGGYDPDHRASREAIARDVDAALTEHGFIAVTNVCVAPALCERAFASARAFFAEPSAIKRRYRYVDPVANFGYQATLSETLTPGLPPDLKEAFTMRDLRGRYDDPAAWPSEAFRVTAREMFDACVEAAFRVLRVFAIALDTDEEFFVSRHGGENLTMRYLHYPDSGYEVASPEQLGAGVHTDYGCVTLLFQDAVGGLQLQRPGGEWMDVPPIADAVNVNTGDLMCHWSNGRYPSTPHRVLPCIGGRERYSIAFFTDPDNDTPVRCLPSCVDAAHPPRFADMTAGEHIQAKIDASQSREAAETQP